jgi:hypothetical protein
MLPPPLSTIAIQYPTNAAVAVCPPKQAEGSRQYTHNIITLIFPATII